MVKSLSKIFILFSISFLLIPIIPQPTLGCGGGYMIDITDVSIFSPDIIGDDKFQPLFLTYFDTFGGSEDSRLGNQGNNTTDWKKYFDNSLDEEHTARLVHEFTIAQLDSIIMLAENKNSRGIAGYEVLSGKSKYAAGLKYLRLAKQMEKFTSSDYYTWQPIGADTTVLKELQSAMLKGWKTEKDKRLKERYGFQVVRGYFLADDYAEGVRFYDEKLKPDLTAKTSMYFRTLGYKAACLNRLDRYAEANYIYSVLYEQYEPERMTSFSSFHPQEETDWNQTLQLAKTPREKTVLWHMFGVYADPLRAMREIVALDPQSDLLDVLLVRSVNIAEAQLLHNAPTDDGYGYMYEDFYGDILADQSENDTLGFIDPYSSWRSIDSSNVGKLISFVEETTTNSPVRKAVWSTAAAYLNWLTKNPAACEKWIAYAEKEATGIIGAQLDIVKTLHRVSGIIKMTPGDETDLLGGLQRIVQAKSSYPALRAEQSERYIRRAMAAIYTANGNGLMSELSESHYIKYLVDSSSVQTMVDFMTGTQRSPIQRFLIESYPIKLYQLYDVQAVSRIYAYDFAGAQAYFVKDSVSGSQELYGNPFNARKVDCHDCDHALPQKTRYTKLSFVAKMLELKRKAAVEKDLQERANNAFLFASGLYNMTWFGNARVVYQTAGNIDISDSYRYSEYNDEPRKQSPFYDCHEAQRWFLSAFNLSKNKEFRAKCAWMAAKCEHNIWLERDGDDDGETSSDGDRIVGGDFRAGVYFRLMKTAFSDTKYYSEVIEECGYFCTYVTPGANCIRNRDQY